MNALDVLREIVGDLGIQNIKAEPVGENGVISIILPGLTAITCYTQGANVKVILPDSIANIVGLKQRDFDLHRKDSIIEIRSFIKAMIALADFARFTEEDKKVIADAFMERLPMVWQDAGEEIKNGKSLDQVVTEIWNGHVLSVLRHCGVEVESWLEEFKEYHA